MEVLHCCHVLLRVTLGSPFAFRRLWMVWGLFFACTLLFQVSQPLLRMDCPLVSCPPPAFFFGLGIFYLFCGFQVWGYLLRVGLSAPPSGSHSTECMLQWFKIVSFPLLPVLSGYKPFRGRDPFYSSYFQSPAQCLLLGRWPVNTWADLTWLCSFFVFLSDLPALNGEKSAWGWGFLLEPKIGTFVIVHLTKKEKKSELWCFGGYLWSWKVDVCIMI